MAKFNIKKEKNNFSKSELEKIKRYDFDEYINIQENYLDSLYQQEKNLNKPNSFLEDKIKKQEELLVKINEEYYWTIKNNRIKDPEEFYDDIEINSTKELDRTIDEIIKHQDKLLKKYS